MVGTGRSRSFAHHALAVLAAAIAGATGLALLWTMTMAFAVGGGTLSPAGWLAMALSFWLGVFFVALPAAGFVLSLLWPVTAARPSQQTRSA